MAEKRRALDADPFASGGKIVSVAAGGMMAALPRRQPLANAVPCKSLHHRDFRRRFLQLVAESGGSCYESGPVATAAPMKSPTSILLLLACVGAIYVLGRDMSVDPAGEDTPLHLLYGTYRVDQEMKPEHSLRFSGDGRIESLIDGVPSGPPSKYLVEGNTLTIKHSCGTIVYAMVDGVLYHERTGLTYRRPGR